MLVEDLVSFWFYAVFRLVIIVFGFLAALWLINHAVGE